MSDKEKNVIRILLIEDNPGDVLLIKEAFNEAQLDHEIDVASDGEEAMDMLKQNGKYKSFVKPSIILLDLNMPRKDGREVLAEIKLDSQLKSIPVIIMTSSKAEIDVVDTYNLHANSYVVKPTTLAQFVDVIKTIKNFWFNVVVLPGPNDHEDINHLHH